MAIDYNSGITSLDAGASDITYTGDEGPRSPQEEQQMQMASLVQEYKDYAMQQEEAGRPVMPFEEWVRSMQSPMAEGGIARLGLQWGGPGGKSPGHSGNVGGAANLSGPAHLSHNAPPTYRTVHDTGAITQTPGRPPTTVTTGGASPFAYTKPPVTPVTTGGTFDIDPRFRKNLRYAAAIKKPFLRKQSFYKNPLNFKTHNLTAYSLGSSNPALADLYKGLGDPNLTIGNFLEQLQTGKYDELPEKITDKLKEHVLENIDFGDTFQKDIVGPYNPVVEPTFKNNQLDIDVEKKQLLHPESAKYLDLAQGGIARLGYRGGQLVQPGPGRPGYQGWQVDQGLASPAPAHHGDVAHGDQGRFNQSPAPVQTVTTTPEPTQRHHAVDTGTEESPYEYIGGTKVYIGDVEGKRIAEEKDDVVEEPEGFIPRYIDKRAEQMYGMVPNKFSWTYDKRKRYFNTLTDAQKRKLGYNFNKDWDELTDTDKDILLSYDVYRDFNEIDYQDWLKTDYEEKFGKPGGGEGPIYYPGYVPGGSPVSGGGSGGGTTPEDPFPTDPIATGPFTNQYNIPGASNFYSNLASALPTGQTTGVTFDPASEMLKYYSADGGRVPAAYGGIMDTYTGRRKYGLGSIFKKVKKLAKSDIGKAALTWAAFTYGPGLLSGTGLGMGTKTGLGGEGGWKKLLAGKFDPSKGGMNIMRGIAGASALGGLFTEDEDEGDDMYEDWLAKKRYWDQQLGGPWPTGPVQVAQGGRIGYAGGGYYDEEEDDRVAAIRALSYRPRAQEGGLMDMGGMEKDYRQEGGFVPLGGEERADDVPARLSKNEFVFTADAVRAAGGGDIDAGAEVMENVMENLEQGGQVSEESQGLEGARNMFATAQRLEGVL